MNLLNKITKINEQKPEVINEEIASEKTNPVSPPEPAELKNDGRKINSKNENGLVPEGILLSELFDQKELESFEERAAIMEFDGELEKQQAEYEATNIILGARFESGLIGSMISELGAVELKGLSEKEINKTFNLIENSAVREEWY